MDTDISGVGVVNLTLYPKNTKILHTDQPNLGVLLKSTGILHVKILKTWNPTTNYALLRVHAYQY